jgi:hypothetical protein
MVFVPFHLFINSDAHPQDIQYENPVTRENDTQMNRDDN